MRPSPPIRWPDGKKFAFSIVDDTDLATIANVAPVYRVLADLGIRTTKTVWPLRPTGPAPLEGGTLEDPAYREWILDLRREGFEIAYHGTTDGPSRRARILEGLEAYRRVLNERPMLYAAHSGQTEAMYWGRKRLDGVPGLVYALLNRVAKRDLEFQGEDPRSPFFWGDVCRETITFARGFTFDEIVTSSVDARMPYHDPRQPFVKWWFSSSDGYEVGKFNELLREENQDLLAESGGCCIVYTHFAFGFCRDGNVDSEFRRLLTRLSTLDGWFAPASSLLTHLRDQPGRGTEVSRRDLRHLQWRWLREQLGRRNWGRYWRRLRRYRDR